jgi:CBS domain containing-hemolysin-like protein
VLTVAGIVAVVALILANGYFVAAEFAFVAAKRSRLEEAAATGDRRSARAVAVRRRLSFMLSSAQFGITVTSLLVGFIAEPTLGRALEPVMGALGVPESARFGVAVAVGFALATIAQMVVGELAPKNLAIARPEPVARAVGSSMLVFMRVASPIVRLFDGAANRLLRAVGIEPVEELHGGVSIEELDLIVEESAQRGALTHRQAALLARALDFPGLHASSVMVPWNKVVTIGDFATGDDLRALAAATGHSRFPVVADGDRVSGVVLAKDLLGVAPGDQRGVRLARLSRAVPVVPESADLRMVLDRLRREATEMAVVVDEYGAPAGVVTLEDVVEELVGEIADEHDRQRSGAVRDARGQWLVPGSWRLDEIEQATGIVLPAGNYETVAGLVLAHLRRVAKVGDRVEVAGTAIEVVELDRWEIVRVRLAPAGDDGGDHPTGHGGER